MSIKDLSLELHQLYSEWPTWSATVSVEQLSDIVQQIHADQGQLLTLFGSDERFQNKGFCLHLIFVFWKEAVLYLQCFLPENDPSYPDLSAIFPVANRLQRALFDLLGVKALGSNDERPWLRHGAWPANIFPLRADFKLTDSFPEEMDHYSFKHINKEGLHEIPVGPVHAGIIEPGHFRFSVMGEEVLNLEERFAYTHKGIAKHFQQASFSKGAKLAGRISGDSTVAYAWAYSMAVENLHQLVIPPRAQWLRALLLERERIMNHLGDLGALGNDAGLSFGLSQFSSLKETILRLNDKLWKHRYLMDLIVPGGVTTDLSSKGIVDILQEAQMLQREVNTLRMIYAEHEGLQDRFVSTGVLTTKLAQQLGMLGLSARASGIPIDWRIQFPFFPYKDLKVRLCTESAGDVAARALVRFQEIETSLRCIRMILKKLPKGNFQTPLPKTMPTQIGLGCVEGWRGPVFMVLCHQDAEHIRYAHVHDPSWQNWPALEQAILGNIVPDFPLINKSFNLSYSGHDG